MIHVAEFAGYLAALLVFLTFYMKTMVPLRIVGICSNCAFITYGYLGGLYPVLILHLVLLPLNSLRLREMLRLTQQVREATRTDLEMDWLKPFSSTRRVSAGDILFRKGDDASAMYFILSGRYCASPRLRLQARQRWPRHPLTASLSWASKHPEYDAIHRPCAGSI